MRVTAILATDLPGLSEEERRQYILEAAEDARRVMEGATALLRSRGIEWCPERWSPEYVGALIQGVIAETVCKVVGQIYLPASGVQRIPRWLRDLCNEECVLAVAEVLWTDIQTHGAA